MSSLQSIMSGKLNVSVHLYDVANNQADGIEVSVADPNTGVEHPHRWVADKAASPRRMAKNLELLLHIHGQELGAKRMDWVNQILERLFAGDFND